MKTKYLLLLFILIFNFWFLVFEFVFAQSEILVSPQIIEEKAKARDLLEYSVKIKNQGKTLYHFYTLVESIDENKALTQWIEIFRGRTEIPAGQEKEIPFSIKIPPNAKPGKYFAQIVFAQGSTAPDAKNNALKFNMPKIVLSIDIEEEAVEKLQIKKFQTTNNFYFNQTIRFILELENIGNKEVSPKSSIHIYDKNGKEIETLKIKESSILPKESKKFEIEWRANQKVGQFKAVVFGEYGQKDEKTFQDSLYFGIFSWQILILFLLIFLILLFLTILIFSIILKKRYSRIS